MFQAAAFQSDTLALLFIVPLTCEGRFNFLPLANISNNQFSILGCRASPKIIADLGIVIPQAAASQSDSLAFLTELITLLVRGLF